MADNEFYFDDAKFMSRIMLVVDGSQAADAAADFAFRMAHKLQCPLTAVYTIDTATMDYLLQMHIFVSDEREDFENALEAKGNSYLQRISRIGQVAGITVNTHIIKGRFHESVLKFARENQMDVLVIGGWKKTSHDKDAFSVERERILDLAECPVFVIKEPRKKQ